MATLRHVLAFGLLFIASLHGHGELVHIHKGHTVRVHAHVI